MGQVPGTRVASDRMPWDAESRPGVMCHRRVESRIVDQDVQGFWQGDLHQMDRWVRYPTGGQCPDRKGSFVEAPGKWPFWGQSGILSIGYIFEGREDKAPGDWFRFRGRG